MAIWIRVLAGVLGLSLQVLVLDAAIRTFLLPRIASIRLSRAVAMSVGWVFRILASEKRSYAVRDRILSLYASILLLTYQALWLALSLVAFALGFVAAGVRHAGRAFEISGSSLMTLGTASGSGGAQVFLGYVEAAIGLTLLALLISFIPTLYSAFQDRELSVSRLSVRAGIPATPWGVLEIAQSVENYQVLDELWREWEQWFIQVGETHSTLTILNYYRSPNPDQTWIGAAATVLDAAALFNAAVDAPPSATAGRLLPHSLSGRRGPHDPDLDYPRAVRPGSGTSRAQWRADRGRPRRGVVGLRRLAGELRRHHRGLPRHVRLSALGLEPRAAAAPVRPLEPARDRRPEGKLSELR
jgi:hypothetical protein